MKMLEWSKWRWEFARRNPKVKKAYRKALKLRDKSGVFQKGRPAKESSHPYSLSPEGKEEMRMCDELGLLGKFMPNPGKSFDEIVEGSDIFEKKQVFPGFWTHFAEVDFDGKFFAIRIDLTKVRSLAALKKVTASILDFYWKDSYKDYYKDEYKPKAVDRRDIDYAKTHRIGVLYEDEQLTFRQIGEQELSDSHKTDLDSAERNAKGYYDRFTKLVEGGYRDLTYP
jgi:hypothetical protein